MLHPGPSPPRAMAWPDTSGPLLPSPTPPPAPPTHPPLPLTSSPALPPTAGRAGSRAASCASVGVAWPRRTQRLNSGLKDNFANNFCRGPRLFRDGIPERRRGAVPHVLLGRLAPREAGKRAGGERRGGGEVAEKWRGAPGGVRAEAARPPPPARRWPRTASFSSSRSNPQRCGATLRHTAAHCAA